MPLDQIDVDKPVQAEEKEMSFLEHLEELRWHLVRAVVGTVLIAVVVFVAGNFVFDAILFGPTKPEFISYRIICRLGGEALCFTPPPIEFITPNFGEKFLTHIKISLMLGLMVAFPYVFWELWRFVRPGLYENERRATRGIVLICSLLFILGVGFGYFVIAPFAVTFLASYNVQGIETATTSLSSFVNYMIMFTLPAGLVFELPVVVYFLAKVGLVTADFMRTYRKHALVIILLAAAIITPPDVVTQFLIGIPLYILYEISIFIAQRIEKQEAEKLA